MRIAVVIVVIATRTASAGDARASYIATALDALHSLGAQRAQLEADLYQACRQAGACSDAIVEARCHRDAACTAAADVIVTNLRAANSWVDQNTRAQLVRSSTDYHAALLRELRKRYAALAAELVIGADGGPSVPGGPAAPNGNAQSIDRLCATRDREVHACTPGDTACVPSIPWTRCVAALVWFVGDNP
ncbi:MAG TPA: hypothetical protein VIV58_22675 [Kofleriaceae bacterium]